MLTRQNLYRAVGAVGFLLAAFSGFLRGIAPPEESAYSVGIASFLMLCIVLLLSTRARNGTTLSSPKLWIGLSAALTVVAAGSAILYWQSREKLTFQYPPERPEGEYVAGTQYTSRAQAWAEATGQNASQIVAKFGGLTQRNRVWSDDSIRRAKLILVTTYLCCVLSLAAAVFSLVELSAPRAPPAHLVKT
jgi:hypothetical protein